MVDGKKNVKKEEGVVVMVDNRERVKSRRLID